MKIKVVCPSCSVHFEVSRNAIPKNGRMVKCSSCLHKWHIKLPEPEIGEWENTIVRTKNSKSNKDYLLGYILIAVLLLGIMFLFFSFRQEIIRHIPQTFNIYKSLGIEVNKTGISLIRPFLEETMDENGNKILYIQGTLINTDSTTTLPLPPVSITLRDAANLVVKEFVFKEFSSDALRPGAVEEFSYQVNEIPANVIDVGIELIVKD